MAVAGHVDDDEFEAGLVERHAEDHGHLAAVGADAVVHYQADFCGGVAPSVEVEEVAAVGPPFFCRCVVGGEMESRAKCEIL